MSSNHSTVAPETQTSAEDEQTDTKHPCKGRKIFIGSVLFAIVVFIGLALGLGLYFGLKRINPIVNPEPSNEVIHCNVVILGAGFAGTYAAYQLANRSGNGVCLIEKLDRFGGRVWDVSGWSDGPVFGVGSLRVTELQRTMLALANELGIELQKQETDNELMRVRGQYFYRDVDNVGEGVSESSLMCKTVFQNLTCEYADYSHDTDKALLSILLKTYHANKSVAFEYPDFPNYILSLFGDEGLAFIRESVRYNSLFTSVSIHSILDFFTNELRAMGLDPDRYYAAGGMSQYIDKMLAHAKKANVRIYRNEPVLRIDFDSVRDRFVIASSNYTFYAQSVLCAIDPINLRNVHGSIADSITSAPEFNVILPKALSIGQHGGMSVGGKIQCLIVT
ncbi:hypothetical protein I4U23_022075 [Adineta vaga]|nr:hypothetical protein I4U23_022075 [Adineta vaga]